MKEINISEIDEYENSLIARDIYCNGSFIIGNNSLLNKDNINYLKRYSDYLIRIYIYDDFEESKEDSSKLIFDNVSKMVEELIDITMKYYSYTKYDDIQLIRNTIKLFLKEILLENYYRNYIENLYINNIEIFNHVIRTMIMSIILAIKLNIPGPAIKELGIGALLHDIGKIKLFMKYPMLNNLQSYNYEEYQLLKTHPTLGYMEVENNPLVPNLSKKIILLHHVWNNFESSYFCKKSSHLSYPVAVYKNKINKEQKDDAINILQVSNYFDNLFVRMENEDINEAPIKLYLIKRLMLDFSNKIYSSRIVNLMFNHFSLFKVDDIIKVDGREAIVLHHTSNVNRPKVKFLDNNETLDLSKNLTMKVELINEKGCDLDEYYNTIRKQEKYYYL